MLLMSRSAGSYHHGNLAEALESAAMSLLETQSAATLSLREVARQAGVSHNAPYHHFGDRQQLLKRVAELAMRDHLAAQESAVVPHTDPRERLLAMGLAYVGYAAAHPNAFAAIYDPDVCIPNHPTPTMAPLIARNEDLLEELARACWPDADDLEIEARCAALWGLVHGLATLVVAGHLPLDATRPALLTVLPTV